MPKWDHTQQRYIGSVSNANNVRVNSGSSCAPRSSPPPIDKRHTLEVAIRELAMGYNLKLANLVQKINMVGIRWKEWVTTNPSVEEKEAMRAKILAMQNKNTSPKEKDKLIELLNQISENQG